jgi:hypothetical protein
MVMLTCAITRIRMLSKNVWCCDVLLLLLLLFAAAVLIVAPGARANM